MNDEIAPNEAAKPPLVLAPGAFTSDSGLRALAARLGARGYRVVVAPYALAGVLEDTAALLGVLRGLDGGKVLVGHSYGGMLIANAACVDLDVQALVFVAAPAPDKGETMEALLQDHPDATPGEISIAGAAGDPGWKLIPSWFVYGDADDYIPSALHARMAERAGAVRTIVVPGGAQDLIAGAPDAVIQAIELAVAATIAQVPNITPD